MSDPRPVDPSLFRQLDQALANLPDDQTPTSQPDPTAPTSASGLCDLLDLLDNYRTESDNTITSDDVNDLQDSLVKARSPMRVAVVDKLSMCLKGEDATTLKALGAFGWATECERVAALLKPKELCHEVGFASTGPDVSKEQLQIRLRDEHAVGRSCLAADAVDADAAPVDGKRPGGAARARCRGGRRQHRSGRRRRCR